MGHPTVIPNVELRLSRQLITQCSEVLRLNTTMRDPSLLHGIGKPADEILICLAERSQHIAVVAPLPSLCKVREHVNWRILAWASAPRMQPQMPPCVFLGPKGSEESIFTGRDSTGQKEAFGHVRWGGGVGIKPGDFPRSERLERDRPIGIVAREEIQRRSAAQSSERGSHRMADILGGVELDGCGTVAVNKGVTSTLRGQQRKVGSTCDEADPRLA